MRVGIAYVIVGWILAQIAEFAAANFGAPDWVLKIFVVFLVLGLPLAKNVKEEETSWNNADVLEFSGRYKKASGYSAHPRFLPLQEEWGTFDVWEVRGPPDDCSKVDGNWVCE